MEKYSEEDIKAFERKDRLNARMSALKAASTVSEGSVVPAEVIIGEADKYYGWLTQDQEWKDGNIPMGTDVVSNNNTVSNLPVPTTEQMKWLNLIKENYGFTQEQVFEAFKKYPANKDQAIEMVKQLKKGK